MMTKFGLLMVSVVAVLEVVFQKTTALKCWRCSTDTSNSAFCDDPFDGTSIITEQQRRWSYVECGPPLSSMTETNQTMIPVCKKVIQLIDDQKVITRSCFWEDPQDPRACFSQSPSYIKTVFCKTCTTDGCNAMPDGHHEDKHIEATISTDDPTKNVDVIDLNIKQQLEEMFNHYHESELTKLRKKFELREERLMALLEKCNLSPVVTVHNYNSPDHISNNWTDWQANNLLLKADQIYEKLSNTTNPTTIQYFDKTKSNNRTRGKYLGCYQDRVEHRGLRGYAVPSRSMTVEKCIEICRNGSYVYAGLQAGSWCLCDNTKQNPAFNSKLNETSCNTYCSGNSSQYCGSGWVNAIYETGVEQFLIDEEGRRLPDSYIMPSSHAYFFLRDDGQAEN